MNMPKFVRITEVGPRDGLQNQPAVLPAADKIDFINRLSGTGLSVIEATAFVSPKWIPQLADHTQVFTGIRKNAGVSYPVLVPNKQGFMEALAAGAEDIAVFVAATESFSQNNINCSVAESLGRVKEVMTLATQHNVRVRGYISCVAGCPFEGKVSESAVVTLSKQLIALGCEEVSLGDTIGVGTPGQITTLLKQVIAAIGAECVAVHFHDTYGQALANIHAALLCGISRLDSSVAGLGGCPYAKGATGNVATEDVLYMLNGLGIETGVDLDQLIQVGRMICRKLKQPVMSKVSLACQN